MRHRGTDVGSFFFADKANSNAFIGGDEEMLSLFASQAGSAIVNAHAHRCALAKAGNSPLMTSEARDLAQLLRREKLRLVLLGLVLPGRDGIALTREVSELADLPIIISG